MKKVLSLIFSYIVFIMPVSAAITPEEATSEAYIQNHGHSHEMSRLINLQNVQINDKKSDYKRSRSCVVL